MKKKNISLACGSKLMNIIGFASLGSLLLLTFTSIIPTITQTSSAISTENTMTASVNTNVATLVRSSISVAVTSQVNLDLTPSSGGTFSTGVAKLDITTNNTTGYAVYLKTKDDTSSLLPVQSGVTESIGEPTGTMTSENFASNLNTWGYSVGEENEYRAIPKSTDAAIIHTTKTDQEDSYDLSFGVAIGPNLPSGIYTNELVVSVVANPIEVRSLTDLTFMQEMTPEVCKISYENETKQLIDQRDGKKYWVAKLADNNCWMTQNLALNLGVAPGATDATKTQTEATFGKFVSELTPNDSDVSNDWTPESNTRVNAIVDSSMNDDDGSYVTSPALDNGSVNKSQEFQYSWGIWQNIVDTKPDTPANCGDKITSDNLASCFVFENYNASSASHDSHYLVGNYYQFNTATAGTGGAIASGNAPDSICPKGWTLPTAGSGSFDTSGAFANLLRYYGLASSDSSGAFTSTVDGTTYNVVLDPLYFVRSGSVYSSKSALTYAGADSCYWSRTSATHKIPLFFNDVFVSTSYNSFGAYSGLSVRCVAR